jgi:hypothetical protein
MMALDVLYKSMGCFYFLKLYLKKLFNIFTFRTLTPHIQTKEPNPSYVYAFLTILADFSADCAVLCLAW